MSFFEAFASGRIQFFFCYCETGRVATWSESNWCVISSESGDKSKKFFTKKAIYFLPLIRLIFHIYGNNPKGKHISTDYFEQGAINKQKRNYVRFYLRNIDTSYFEIRLNANPVVCLKDIHPTDKI